MHQLVIKEGSVLLMHGVTMKFSDKCVINLLKLVIPTTNAVPRWRLNDETKTKRTLHGSRRLSLMNSRTQNILCCIVAILLSTDAAARLCARRAL